MYLFIFVLVFFFNYPATTETYTYGHTLSLPDALPISQRAEDVLLRGWNAGQQRRIVARDPRVGGLGVLERTFFGDGDEAVEFAIMRLDALEVMLGQLAAAEFLLAQAGAELGDGEVMHVDARTL